MRKSVYYEYNYMVCTNSGDPFNSVMSPQIKNSVVRQRAISYILFDENKKKYHLHTSDLDPVFILQNNSSLSF